SRHPPMSALVPYTRSSDLLNAARCSTTAIRWDPINRVSARRWGGCRTMARPASTSVRLLEAGPFIYDREITTDIRSAAREEPMRSEEHTSELQSRENLVCR